MYSKHLVFGQDDYLELASRITTDGEDLLLSLRGKKSNDEVTVSSVLLSKTEAEDLIKHLQGWLATLN